MPERISVLPQLQNKSEHLRVALQTPVSLEARSAELDARLENMPIGQDYLDSIVGFGAKKQRIRKTIDTFINQAGPVLEERLVQTEQHIQDIRRAYVQLDQVIQLHQQGIVTDSQWERARQSAEAIEAGKAQFLSVPKQWTPQELRRMGFRRMVPGSGVGEKKQDENGCLCLITSSGPLALDVQNKIAISPLLPQGIKIELTVVERDILAALLNSPDLVVPDNFIEGLINPHSRRYNISIRGIQSSVQRLRKKLGDKGDKKDPLSSIRVLQYQLIHRRGKGYSLNPLADQIQENLIPTASVSKEAGEFHGDKMLLKIAQAERKYLSRPTEYASDYSPRLSTEEQIILAHQVQAEIIAIRRLEEELLSDAERNSLVADIAAGALARQCLTVTSFGLVKSIAFRYRQIIERGISLDDIIQEGMKGVMRAILTYDSQQGAFSTYAGFWIRQNILRAVDEMKDLIRVPMHEREERKRFKRMAVQLEDKLGGKPTLSELAEKLGIPQEKAAELDLLARREYLLFSQKYGTLDSLEEGHNGSITIGEYIADFVADPAQPAQDEPRYWAVVRKRLQEVFKQAGLKEQVIKILEFRFGFSEDGREYTLEEIPPLVGFTSGEGVRQAQIRGLGRIRGYLREHPDIKRELGSYLHYSFD